MNEIIKRLIDTKANMRFAPRASETMIKKYEDDNSVCLPIEYHEWLMFSDGGQIFVPGTVFFGVDKNSEHSLYSENEEILREPFSIKKSYLIIGLFNFGDLICADTDTGEIIQWDHESDEEFLRWTDFFEFLNDEISSYINEE